MNANPELNEILEEFAYPYSLDHYAGEEKTYFTYNYTDERAEWFADDLAREETAYIDIHFFCPTEFDYMELKKRLSLRLEEKGFAYPDFQALINEDTKRRHLIFGTNITKSIEREE